MTPGRRVAAETVFGALADPTRLAIIARLRGGKAAAGEIAAGFRISRPAVSRHIRVLRRAQLVREQRIGRTRIYELNAEPLRFVDDWLAVYRPFWRNTLQSLKRHAEGTV